MAQYTEEEVYAAVDNWCGSERAQVVMDYLRSLHEPLVGKRVRTRKADEHYFGVGAEGVVTHYESDLVVAVLFDSGEFTRRPECDWSVAVKDLEVVK